MKIKTKLFTALTALLMPLLNFAQDPNLGTAANFVLFTSAGAVTNTGTSQVTGNVGSNNTAPTGFGNVNGTVESNNAATAQCASDLTNAYNQLNADVPNFSHGISLGNGETLVAGTYSVSAAATLNQNLYLSGSASDVFIFQINGTFSTNASSKVHLLNGALACNVFWKVEGAVTMAAGTTMRGTVIANNGAINLGAGDTLEGRALSTTGAVGINGTLAYTPIGCGSPSLTGPTAPNLASTVCYTLFSSNGPVTDNGSVSNITGDIGTNIGSTTGYNPLFVTGTIHPVPDASTAAAASDLTNVYNYLNNLSYSVQLLYPAQLGNGLVLTPNTYWLNGAATLTDTLFLNAEGDANAVFVFQIEGALTESGTSTKIKLINGAQAQNVFWLINGAVTLNNFSVFNGTIVSNAAITLNTGDTLFGRALTTAGALNTTAIVAKMTPGCCNHPPVITNISQTAPTCAGETNGSATLTASGGTGTITYKWNNNSSTTGATLTSGTGSYTVTATDANSCSATASVTITQPNAVTASASQTGAPICYGNSNGTAAVSSGGGTPAITYQWNDSHSTTGATLTGGTGSYTVIAIDANSCSATASVTITQPSAVTVSASETFSGNYNANNQIATAISGGGAGTITYQWNNNTTGAMLTTGVGTYTVTATDTHGCSATASVTITQPGGFTVSASETFSGCYNANNQNATATSMGGAGNVTYTWSNNATGATLTAGVGTYTVTATDANNSTATASVIITQPSVLAFGIAGHVTVPFSFIGSLQTWTVPAGVTNITLAVIGAEGGADYENLNFGGFGASITGICTVIAGHILNIVSGGVGTTDFLTDGGAGGGGSYIWDNNNSTLLGAAGGGGGGGENGGGYSGSTTISPNPSGGTGELGGTALDLNAGGGGAGLLGNGSGNGNFAGSGGNDKVNGFAGGAGDVSGNDNCCNNFIKGGYGGGGGAGYHGGGGGGGYNGGNGLAAGFGGAGGGSYLNGTITASHNNNSGTGGVVITYPIPPLLIVNHNVTCYGGSNGTITSPPPIGGTSSYRYSWSPGGGSNAIASNLTAGTYTITVIDANGCTISASATITQPILLTLVSANETFSGCYNNSNGSATASANGGTVPYTYAWSGGGTSATNATLSAGTYTVTVHDNCGSSVTASIIITQPATAVTIAYIFQTNPATCNICANGSASLTASGGTGTIIFLWNDNNSSTGTNLTALPGTYTVIVSDANGCSATASVRIITQLTQTNKSVDSLNYKIDSLRTAFQNIIVCIDNACDIQHGATHHNNGNETSGDNNVANIQYGIPSDTVALLNQNTPNPFSSRTKINYYLPKGITESSMVFYDNNGIQIKTIVLPPTPNGERGGSNGVLNISPGNLDKGMYSYSLVANGKVIDTKKMLLQK